MQQSQLLMGVVLLVLGLLLIDIAQEQYTGYVIADETLVHECIDIAAGWEYCTDPDAEKKRYRTTDNPSCQVACGSDQTFTDTSEPFVQITTKLNSDSKSVPIDYNIASATTCGIAIVNRPLSEIDIQNVARETKSCSTNSDIVFVGESGDCTIGTCSVIVFADDAYDTLEFEVVESGSEITTSSGCIDLAPGWEFCTDPNAEKKRFRTTESPSCSEQCGGSATTTSTTSTTSPTTGSPIVDGLNLKLVDVEVMDTIDRGIPTGFLSILAVVENSGTRAVAHNILFDVTLKNPSGQIICRSEPTSSVWNIALNSEERKNYNLGLKTIENNQITSTNCQLEKGAYSLEVIMDEDNRLVEQDESDNNIIKSVGTQGAAGQQCPDGEKNQVLEGTVWYCDENGKRQNLKDDGATCAGNNHFECKSSFCAGQCIGTCTGQFSGEQLIWPHGTVHQGIYCDVEGESKTQINHGSCTNNGECRSNLCVINSNGDGFCVPGTANEDSVADTLCKEDFLPGATC